MPYVNNDGYHIHYEIEGEGPPLVLHHGLSDSWQGWYEFNYVEQAQGRCQLIMIDARGHGDSDKPHNPGAYSLEAMTSDVVAVLDALEIFSAHYYGNSLGGLIGFGLADYAPKRIRSFSLGGAHPYDRTEERRFLCSMLGNTMQDWVNALSEFDAGLSEQTKQRFCANDHTALETLLGQDWYADDISYVLPKMVMPCLLFAGSKDVPAHTNLQRVASEIAQALFVSLPGLNHFQVYVQGDLVVPLLWDKVLDFIGQIEQGDPIQIAV